MIKNSVVVGDLHLTYKKPKYNQVIDFLDWLFSSEYNSKENELILLGDLVEEINSPNELLEVYIDYFLNRSKFERIKILQGNHDCNIESTYLSAFRPIRNIQIVTQAETQEYEQGTKILFLPFYQHENINKPPMLEYYSSILKDNIKEINFDFCLHHVEDETNHFSNNFCDLSWINKNCTFLCGHIHTENINKGGRYLGSPILNSKTESQKTPYIAVINHNTKKHTLIEVPKWLEYYEVTYPNDLTIPTTKYAIFTVYESLNKEEIIQYYTKQAQEKGFVFYHRRVFSKRIKKEDFQISESNIQDKSTLQYFEEYCKTNNVENTVQDLCKEVLLKR